tara:strand:- start:121 stop:441 length:321 start_codon:yes stop_codon:yes gene_type:complete
MRIGRLRDRLILQGYGDVKDAIGGTNKAWFDVGTLWAEVRGVSGRAYLSASAEQAEVTAEILIRYRSDVEAGMRLVRGTDVYTIVAPLPDAKRTELRCMCTRGVKQ